MMASGNLAVTMQIENLGFVRGGSSVHRGAAQLRIGRLPTGPLAPARRPTLATRSEKAESPWGVQRSRVASKASRQRGVVQAAAQYEAYETGADTDWDAEETVAYGPGGRWAESESLVQWYPGHIARAERELRASLKLVDVVIEVRDARIPLSTSHPDIKDWISNRKHIVVLNRMDLISKREQRTWTDWFESQGQTVLFTNARYGKGIQAVARSTLKLSGKINEKREKRGLQPRSVRCAVVGFPNVGKSALINRLVGKSICESASRAGVTRNLKWVRVADNIDLLDSPGVLPPRLADQAAAARLAMCNDIGETAYVTSLVATAMLTRFQYLQGPEANQVRRSLVERYQLDIRETSPEEFIEMMADNMFKGDQDVAGTRLLLDYQKGRLGTCGLEEPPMDDHANWL